MEQKKKIKTKIISRAEISEDIYDLWIDTELALTARAGQFVGVFLNNESMLLPRPISICEADRVKGRLRLVYRTAGQGTQELAAYQEGESISILGNLGNGFPLAAAAGKRVLLMGGGIGIPPMLQLAKDLQQEGRSQSVEAAAGYRNNQLFLKKDMEKYVKVYAATEDGSTGTAGNVLNAVSDNDLEADIIMACGPMPMLRAIKRYAQENHIQAYISLEERMACGVGACLGCVCRTTKKDAHSHVNHARICTDGPVFNADDVDI